MSGADNKRVVVRFKSGRIEKGLAYGLDARLKTFSVLPSEGRGPAKDHSLHALKAVFYVTSFTGSKERKKKRAFADDQDGAPIRVAFRDGEVLYGRRGDNEGDAGFWMTPDDPEDNATRIFVPSGAPAWVEALDENVDLSALVHTPPPGMAAQPATDSATEDMLRAFSDAPPAEDASNRTTKPADSSAIDQLLMQMTDADDNPSSMAPRAGSAKEQLSDAPAPTPGAADDLLRAFSDAPPATPATDAPGPGGADDLLRAFSEAPDPEPAVDPSDPLAAMAAAFERQLASEGETAALPDMPSMDAFTPPPAGGELDPEVHDPFAASPDLPAPPDFGAIGQDPTDVGGSSEPSAIDAALAEAGVSSMLDEAGSDAPSGDQAPALAALPEISMDPPAFEPPALEPLPEVSMDPPAFEPPMRAADDPSADLMIETPDLMIETPELMIETPAPVLEPADLQIEPIPAPIEPGAVQIDPADLQLETPFSGGAPAQMPTMPPKTPLATTEPPVASTPPWSAPPNSGVPNAVSSPPSFGPAQPTQSLPPQAAPPPPPERKLGDPFAPPPAPPPPAGSPPPAAVTAATPAGAADSDGDELGDDLKDFLSGFGMDEPPADEAPGAYAITRGTPPPGASPAGSPPSSPTFESDDDLNTGEYFVRSRTVPPLGGGNNKS